MHQRFCRVCRNWHDLNQSWPSACLPDEPQRSHLAAPMLIMDTMPPVQSMATGKMHDSKAAIRAEYKALGMVEVGNDPARNRPRTKPKTDRTQIKNAMLKAEARFNRGERVSKTA